MDDERWGTGQRVLLLTLETIVILILVNPGSYFYTTTYRKAVPAAGYSLTAILMVWMVLRTRSLGFGRKDLGLTLRVRRRWWGLTLALSLFILALGIWVELGTPASREPIPCTALLGTAAFNLAFGPVFEEFLFRSYLFARASQAIGDGHSPGPATSVFAGVAFGLWHLPTPIFVLYTGDSISGIYSSLAPTILTAVLVGILLGEIRRRSGSVLPCVALHAAANSLNTISLLL